jgi:hypothetical protein
MREFIENVSLHAPLFATEESFLFVLAVCLAAGVALGIFCRLVYGAFLLWGFLVGSIGLLLLWVLVAALPVKWALVLAAAVALPIALLFYIDEKSEVTAAEFEAAAAKRDIDLEEMFSGDPDAAEIMAEIANLDVEDPSNDWPEGSMFQGIPKRVVRNAALMLLGGYLALSAIALIIIMGN